MAPGKSKGLAMLVRVMAVCLSVLVALPAQAQCTGRDLLSGGAFPAARAAAARDTFGSGNHWRARRGDTVVHVVGTFHIDDPRLDAPTLSLAAVIAAADVLLVEAGPDEMAAVKREIARRPELLFLKDGPTLPDLLSPADWRTVREQAALRGIPGFFAAKFQPWYLTMLLGLPVCAVPDPAAPPAGLDQRLVGAALARGVPVRALEPFDTVFRLFGAMTMETQLDLVRASLPMSGAMDDIFVTTIDAYFRQEHRLIWEFSRQQALASGTAPPEVVEAQFALLEETLLDRRNAVWMEVIAKEAGPGKTLVVAVGAAHLSGKGGLLAALESRGFTLDRQPF